MNTRKKCNYSVAVGIQANTNSYEGPCVDGHQFAVQPAQGKLFCLQINVFALNVRQKYI